LLSFIILIPVSLCSAEPIGSSTDNNITSNANDLILGVMGIKWGETVDSVKKRFPDLIATAKDNDTNSLGYKRAFGDNEVFGIRCEGITYYFTDNKFSMLYCVTSKKNKNDTESDAKVVFNTFTNKLGNPIHVDDKVTQKDSFSKSAKWITENVSAEISIGNLPYNTTVFGFYNVRNNVLLKDKGKGKQ